MAEDQKSKEVAARNAAKEASVAEYYALSEAAKPTPTQEENDLATVGALDIDKKEDDGSEWEADSVRRVMEGNIPGNNPYDTRSMDDSGSESSAPRRGRKKAE
jgi:hypothetical protein